MSADELLCIADYTSLRHLVGPNIIDSHGASSAQNLFIFAQKLFRLKIAHARERYEGPFNVFHNNSYRYDRMKSFRVHVGDLSNHDHTHVFNDLMQAVLDLFQVDLQSYYQDPFDNECKSYRYLVNRY